MLCVAHMHLRLLVPSTHACAAAHVYKAWMQDPSSLQVSYFPCGPLLHLVKLVGVVDVPSRGEQGANVRLQRLVDKGLCGADSSQSHLNTLAGAAAAAGQSLQASV